MTAQQDSHTARQSASTVTEHLHALTARITQVEPADAASLLSGALAENGILDAVRALLNTAVDFVSDRAGATGQDGNQSVYTLWHTLSAAADILHSHAPGLHRAPRLLRDLTSPGARVEGRSGAAPQPPRPHGWAPPIAKRETPAALEAIGARLDAGTTPVCAALLTAAVFDPDGGVLDRLSDLLASTSRYAQERGAAPELWQGLGRASQYLGDISQTLAGTAAGLAELSATTGSCRGQGNPPGRAVPTAGGDGGRRR